MNSENWLIEFIIRGTHADCQKAILYLYTNCYPTVRKWVSKEGTDQQAEDIFQDGITQMYDNLLEGKFRNDSKLTTYLISICKNLWLMELRRNKVLFNDKLVVDKNEELEADIDDTYLFEVQSELDNDCRSILRLYYYEKKPIEKLKAIFDLGSEQAVRNKKYRCLKKLMEIIDKRGLTYDSFIK